MPRVETTYERFDYDFYPTPPSCVASIYRHIEKIHPEAFYNGKVIDVGAGTGIWGQVLKEVFSERSHYLFGVDIQRLPVPFGYDHWISNSDFLEEDLKIYSPFSLVVSNPPFKLAEEFVRKSLNLTKHGGYVIMLVRLAFLESIKRGTGLFREYPPRRVVVLSRRPSFHLDKKTGSLAYSAMVWQKGVVSDTVVDWLNWDYTKEWDKLRKQAREHINKLGLLNKKKKI